MWLAADSLHACWCTAHHLLCLCLVLPLPQAQPLLLLCLFQLHLVRRALETSLIMRYSPGDVMHGIAYLFGMRYISGR